MTAYQVYLPAVVTPEELVEGNTKMQGSASAAAFAGPGLAGLVAQLLGAVTALLFNAISFVVSAACLLGARRTAGRSGHPSPQRPAAPRRRSTLRREIADGLLLVLRDPFLRQLSVFWAVANLALTGYAALLVVFLVRVVGLTPVVVGLLAAIPGIGGILGALITGRVTGPCGTARGRLRRGQRHNAAGWQGTDLASGRRGRRLESGHPGQVTVVRLSPELWPSGNCGWPRRGSPGPVVPLPRSLCARTAAGRARWPR
jgi:Major Facilitator Superfamily